MTFYSVGAAIDSLGWGRFQVMMSMIAGFAYMADAMEMMILSILGPALHCQWNISEYEQASMTTVVFLGEHPLGRRRRTAYVCDHKCSLYHIRHAPLIIGMGRSR